MAKIKDGIFGGFSGKIGNVVGVFRNGKYHLRSLPNSVKNPKTHKQQTSRNGFGLTAQLGSVINPFIQQGFKTAEKEPWHAAMSAIRQSAIRGEQPNVFINYQYLKVAAGMLMPPKGTAVYIDASDNLIFQWEDNSGEGNAKPGDQAMLLVINTEKMQCVYELKNAGRDVGQAFLEMPAFFKESELHAYMAFISEDESMVSDSVYIPL